MRIRRIPNGPARGLRANSAEQDATARPSIAPAGGNSLGRHRATARRRVPLGRHRSRPRRRGAHRVRPRGRRCPADRQMVVPGLVRHPSRLRSGPTSRPPRSNGRRDPRPGLALLTNQARDLNSADLRGSVFQPSSASARRPPNARTVVIRRPLINHPTPRGCGRSGRRGRTRAGRSGRPGPSSR
jgi:hypothetical protein